MDNNKVLGIIIVFICLLVFFNINSKSETDKNTPSKTVAGSTQTQTSRPAEKQPTKTEPATTVQDDSAKIARLDSLARSILLEAEKRNTAGMQPYFQQMQQEGVTQVSQPQVAAKATPTCQPIRMELEKGHVISGSVCARMLYVYNGKEHYVGYCRP